MLHLRWVFLGGFLLPFFGLNIAHAGSADTFDANTFYSTDGSGHVSLDRGPWDFSLSAGGSFITRANTTISSVPADVNLQGSGGAIFLLFPAETYTVNSLSRGYSLQLAITRRLFSDWIGLGLQGGVSLGNGQQVLQGNIPFVSVNETTGDVTVQLVQYNINYSLLVYHVEPILQVGPWIPLGNYGFKPYVSIGGGLNQTVETVAFITAHDVDIQLARRSTTSFGVLTGAGIDLQLWQSGTIGAEYQYQRIFSSPSDWTLGLPTLRFSYLF